MVGHRRPHPLVELAAELLDQRLLLLGDLDIALGDELLAEARTHAKELHRRATIPQWSWLQAMPGVRPRGQAQDVDRTRAAPDPAQAVANRAGRDRAGGAGRLERAVAERQVSGQRRGVGAAGAVRGAVGVPLARDQVDAVAVEQHVGGLLAVAAGDHDDVGAEGVERAGQLLDVARARRRRPARAPRAGWG